MAHKKRTEYKVIAYHRNSMKQSILHTTDTYSKAKKYMDVWKDVNREHDVKRLLIREHSFYYVHEQYPY